MALVIVGLGLSHFMHIFRLYTTTV